MDVSHLLLGLDPLSRVFAAAFLLVGVPCLMYTLSLQKDARLAVASLAFIGAALGVVTATDLLRFLIFWELAVLVACYLIVHQELRPFPRPGRRNVPVDASIRRADGTFAHSSFPVAYRYFLVQMVAGTSLFFAVAVQYAHRGSFAMDVVEPRAMPFFLAAFLIKAAVVPFHIWVPLTYPCVSPAVAVVLSAYATKIGVYACARLLPGIPWVAYAGAFMALFGVVMALRQRTARRLLSYHLISQVGYMIAGIGVGTELGMAAAALHMFHNMVYKSLLFMVAGAVLYRQGTDVLARVGGVGRFMPVTFSAAVVGAAAISGLPPLNGYMSKTMLKAGTEGYPLLQGALLLAGVGTAYSFAKFLWYLFLDRPTGAAPVPVRPKEMPLGVCLSMGILAVLCLVQGVFYRPFFAMASDAAPQAMYGWDQLLLGALPFVLGVALYALSRGAASPLRRVRPVPTALPAPAAALLAPSLPTESTCEVEAARCPAPDGNPPDLDLLYAWLLHRALRWSQQVAARATDETQAYLLAITALLAALVVLLWW